MRDERLYAEGGGRRVSRRAPVRLRRRRFRAVAPPGVKLRCGALSSRHQDAALRRSPLFESLSGRQLAQVARLSDDLEAPAGTVLCKEGSRGQEFFVIIDGEATVTRAGEQLATVGSGDFFGEVALLEPVKRTATVTAATPMRFFVVGHNAFQSVLDTDPAVERKVLRAVVRRLVSLSGDPTLS